VKLASESCHDQWGLPSRCHGHWHLEITAQTITKWSVMVVEIMTGGDKNDSHMSCRSENIKKFSVWHGRYSKGNWKSRPVVFLLGVVVHNIATWSIL